MSLFTDDYVNLLIKQYWQQPNASAEIALQAVSWEKIRDLLNSFEDAIDIDAATGKSLDIIGKIVGLRREELSEVGLLTPPIDDETYRFFIRLKIAVNTVKPYMISADGDGIQDAIQFAFSGFAYVVDNQNMTLGLIIEEPFETEILIAILNLGLLPKPAAVGYEYIIQIPDEPAFGFSELINEPLDLSDGSPLVLSTGSPLTISDYTIQGPPPDIDGFSELGDVPLEGGEFSELFGAP